MKKFAYIGTICLMFVAFTVIAQDARFRAVANTSEVYVGQNFRYTITMENAEIKDFRPPSFEGFEAYGPSTMSSFNWVNGKTSQTKEYSYTLRPLSEGEFTISPAYGRLEGKEVKTNPITIKVVKSPSGQGSAATPPAPNSQSNRQSNKAAPQNLEDQLSEALFVRVIPDKTKVKVGEQVTLTYKVYYKVSFQDVQVTKAPSYDGFLQHEIDLGKGPVPEIRENYNNQVYTTQVFKKIAVFPTHAGTYTIDPMEFQGVILVQKKDPFFNHPFFTTTQPYEHKFKSNAIRIEADALPGGAPSSFSGAVGVYDFSVELDKNVVKADDALTLKVKVSGQGNINNIVLPKPTFPNSFETYDPKINESVSKQSALIKGSKTEEYLVIPRSGGTFEIPALEFTYFDVNKRQYVTKTSQAFSVDVEGESSLAGNTSTASSVNKEDLKLLSEDIRYIRSGELKNRKSSFIIHSVWYPVTWGLLMASFFPIFIFTARHRKDQKDVIAVKRKKAGKVATQRLSKANKLLQSGSDKEFYQEISASLWTYLSDKLNIPTIELSKENLETKLTEKGIKSELFQKLQNIWASCEMALYAKSTPSDKENILEQAKATINQLEEVLS